MTRPHMPCLRSNRKRVRPLVAARTHTAQRTNRSLTIALEDFQKNIFQARARTGFVTNLAGQGESPLVIRIGIDTAEGHAWHQRTALLAHIQGFDDAIMDQLNRARGFIFKHDEIARRLTFKQEQGALARCQALSGQGFGARGRHIRGFSLAERRAGHALARCKREQTEA